MRVVAFAAVIGEFFNSARNLGQAVKEIRLGVDFITIIILFNFLGVEWNWFWNWKVFFLSKEGQL